MTKLSEINEAFNDRNVSANEYGRLRDSWFIERGLGTETIDDTMRYIERLEDRISEAEKVITDLSNGVACVLRFSGSSEEYIAARLKQAHDLLAQHEREEAR